jgi:hypothetical protein
MLSAIAIAADAARHAIAPSAHSLRTLPTSYV